MRQPDVAGFRWAGGIVVALRTDPEGIVTAAPSILNLTDQASDRMSVGRMHATDAVGYRDAYTAALDWLEFPTLADGVDDVEVVDEPLGPCWAGQDHDSTLIARTRCAVGHLTDQPTCSTHAARLQAAYSRDQLSCSVRVDDDGHCGALVEHLSGV